MAALLSDTRRDLRAAAVILLVISSAVAWSADVGASGVLMAMLWFAAGAALITQGLRKGTHPHRRFGIANRITLTRMALAGLLVALVEPLRATESDVARHPLLPWAVVALATLTAALDAVDGALARRSGLTSAFGARFDMETDAAYTLVLCALVWQAGQTGPWVLAAGLLRYAFVAAAWRWQWLAAPLPPSRRRQAMCVVQISSLIVCLAPVVPPAMATALAASSLAMLGLSFAADVRILAHRRSPPPAS